MASNKEYLVDLLREGMGFEVMRTLFLDCVLAFSLDHRPFGQFPSTVQHIHPSIDCC